MRMETNKTRPNAETRLPLRESADATLVIEGIREPPARNDLREVVELNIYHLDYKTLRRAEQADRFTVGFKF